MDIPPLVVITKFAPPRIGSRTIARAHLVPRLQEGRHRKLTLLVGGAGFGKTTLMAQWRQELGKGGARPVWMSLAPDDGPLPRFCAHLHAALRQAGVAIGDDVLLSPCEIAEPPVLAGLLLNALAQVPGELYLMLDDFHHVADPATLRLVQALLDATPPGLHIAIAARAAPPLLLGRLRAMGELSEVDGAQLAFDFRETLDFLRIHLDARIDLDAANHLHSLSGGWPIGLQLAAISLKANPANRARLRTLAPDSGALEAYLSEDVLTGLPPGLADFMQKLSVLRRFEAGVAAHVTGRADANALIAAIEARNLFLVPAEGDDGSAEACHGGRQWYRFHPMFAEYLARRLAAQAATQAVDIPALHARATQWFARHGLIEEAIRHALLGDDFHAVVALIERSITPAATLSQMGHFLRWLERVPADRLRGHPAVQRAAAWACALTARPCAAEAWVRALADSGVDVATSRNLRLLRAFLAAQRDDTATLSAELAALGDAPMHGPVREHIRVALTISCLAWHGRHPEARAFFNAPEVRGTRGGDHELALIARSAMASALLTTGNVREAERIGVPALALAEARYGRRSVSACVCAAMLAAIWQELDRIEAARELLANRLDMLRLSMPYVALRATLAQARAKWLQEGAHPAMAYLAEEEARFRARGADRCVVQMVAAQLRLALHGGDWRHAEALQADIDDIAARYPVNNAGDQPEDVPENKPNNKPAHKPVSNARDSEIRFVADISRARVALVRHAPESARRLATALGYGRVLVTVDLLQACALDGLGREAEALDCLRSALAAGYRLGLVRTLLDEDGKVRGLLGRLEGRLAGLGEDPAALADYLRLVTGGAGPAHAPAARVAPAVAPPASPDGVLTRRELEIVALLEQAMSNKRIALTLNLSVQTVKWNLKKIFAKLGVSSRYDAIVAARGAAAG